MAFRGLAPAAWEIEMRSEYNEGIQEYAQRLMGDKTGEVVSLMIHIGDELGLYDAMAGEGKVNAASLAKSTGLNERWVLEWLRGQGAAGIGDHLGQERFQLSDVAAEALLKEDSPSCVQGFSSKPLPTRSWTRPAKHSVRVSASVGARTVTTPRTSCVVPTDRSTFNWRARS
jgi:hypothetical protein